MSHHFKIIAKSALIALFTAYAVGCSIYKIDPGPLPKTAIPEKFDNPEATATEVSTEWWKEFGSEELDALMEKALGENWDIRKTWSRLAQARATYIINRAPLFPSFEATTDASRQRFIDERGTTPFGFPVVYPKNFVEDIRIGGSLAYELDVWRRIASLKHAAQFNLDAARFDIQATSYVVAGNLTDAWLSLREQVELLGLLSEQIEANKTQLELLELRLGVGQANALDVLQQRQQLAATTAEIPRARSLLETSEHQLNVLLGHAPQKGIIRTKNVTLPALPPLPTFGKPIDLLEQRPDIRAARDRLIAADYEVAAAIAERLPRLTLTLSYDFQASDLTGPLTQETGTILGNLVAPLFQGGRLAAKIRKRQAIVQERLAEYTHAFLTALLEIENALTQERRQGELITAIQTQTNHARRSLEESRARYLNGLNDYLPVLTALQSLQALERRIIQERRQQLSFRANLYRALGGAWPEDLIPPNSDRPSSGPKPREADDSAAT